MTRRKRNPLTTFDVVAEIDSDSAPGVLHLIKRRVSTGALSCDCMAYRFKRGEKTCKHVAAFQTATLRAQLRETLDRDFTGMPLMPPRTPSPEVDYTEQQPPRPGVRRLRVRDSTS